MVYKEVIAIITSLILILGSNSMASENNKTLVIFSTDWCKYCKIAKSDMENNEQLKEVLSNYNIIKVNSDLDKATAKGYNVKSIPCFVLLDEDGKEISRQQGYRSKQQLIDFLK
jgi:thioredoxin-related protein